MKLHCPAWLQQWLLYQSLTCAVPVCMHHSPNEQPEADRQTSLLSRALWDALQVKRHGIYTLKRRKANSGDIKVPRDKRSIVSSSYQRQGGASLFACSDEGQWRRGSA